MLKDYLQDIFKTSRNNDSTEASYYSDLKKLLETYLVKKGKVPNITVIPKKTDVGIPDFTIRRGHELIGYIEAKDPKYEDLAALPARDTEQLDRYKSKLPNLILTNFFDFWLWRKEEKRWVKKVRIGMPRILNSLKMAPPPQKEDEFFDLLAAFFNYYIPERKSAKSLAEELADRAQLLPPYIIDLLTNNKDEEIYRIYNSFTEFLIPDLSKEDFADIYAQTITYGLFTARLRSKNGKEFNRFEAQGLLPKNLSILYHTFNLISSGALPESLEWLVTDISTILANADMEKIREELTLRKGDDDPFIHFYEDFLAAYDPTKKKSRGVFYTPFPIVSYITKSLNQILKDKNNFGIDEGFASNTVTSLDFASGTLTFPVNAVKLAFEEYKKWNPDLGGVTGFIKNHVLKDFYAFELLMAPYVLGHLKISLFLDEYNYTFDSSDNDDRFKLFLTNTLDFDPVKESNQPFTFFLSEEGKNALEVKKNKHILVVMGNPPYKKHSVNKTKFTESEMDVYKEDVRDEKNLQPLSDDYIKFIRFAHWKIDKADAGVVGIITNNSYLSGAIHKGMRRKLLESFDHLYILNLHGDSNIDEISPTGEGDENVFDIKQGVTISFFIKNRNKGNKSLGKIFYKDLWGKKETKYKFLLERDWTDTDWKKIEIDPKNYFFYPAKKSKDYDKFLYLPSIFEKFSSGIVTGKDDFFIDQSKYALKARAIHAFGSVASDSEIQTLYDLNNSAGAKIIAKRKQFPFDEEKIVSYFYRPFDIRFLYFEPKVFERPRLEITNNLLSGNIALITSRLSARNVFNNSIVVNSLPDYKLGDKTRGSYIFPLYLYDNLNEDNKKAKQQSLLDNFTTPNSKNFDGKKSNIKTQFINSLISFYKSVIKPEEVFEYIYAILFSNIYRYDYCEELTTDFPKVPFTDKFDLFKQASLLGKKLISLHLLEDDDLKTPTAQFFGKDSELVHEKIEYKNQKIFINETQYFYEVKKEVWDFSIGGYKVLDRWLKDRIGKYLDEDDIRHVCKTITAISKTLEIQNEIDKLYPRIEKNLIKLS